MMYINLQLNESGDWAQRVFKWHIRIQTYIPYIRSRLYDYYVNQKIKSST